MHYDQGYYTTTAGRSDKKRRAQRNKRVSSMFFRTEGLGGVQYFVNKEMKHLRPAV